MLLKAATTFASAKVPSWDESTLLEKLTIPTCKLSFTSNNLETKVLEDSNIKSFLDSDC